MRPLLTAVLLLTLALPAPAGIKRSTKARRQFQRTHPCPATGKPRGRCPGYVIDHVIPLACGGADVPANMEWQPVVEAKAKDRIERRGCQNGKQAK